MSRQNPTRRSGSVRACAPPSARALCLAGLIASVASGLTANASGNVAFVDVAQSVDLDFTSTGTAVLPEVPAMQPMPIAYRAMGTGAAVGDYDGDGDLDVYLLGHLGQPNRLFRNDHDLGQKHFTDVTPAVLADTGFSRLAHFVDLDGDGDRDLLLINDGDQPPVGPILSRSRVFRNEGGGAWSDVTSTSGFEPLGFMRAGCGLVDYDGDGLIDIYVSNWSAQLGASPPPMFPGQNELYRNLGGLAFDEVTSLAGLPGLDVDSFTPVFADFDDDGDRDLLVAVDHTSDYFFRNDGGTFNDVTSLVGTDHVGNDMGVACADFDGDQDLDCFATNIADPSGEFGTTQGNVLYRNRLVPHGSLGFDDVASSVGVWDTAWGWGTEAIDVEHDGDVDLVAVTGLDELVELEGTDSPVYQTPSYLFVNDGSGSFVRMTGTGLDATDDSRGLAAFDYDRDGDLDLLVTNRNQPVRLFENQTSGAGHWIGLSLGPDAKAFGATVRVTVAGVTQRRDVIPGRSYLVGLPPEVHFGVAGATAIDSIEITWADGLVETMTDVSADQWLSATHGSFGSAALPSLAPAMRVSMALGIAWVGRLTMRRWRRR